jgi:hypothetical protein
MGISPALDFHCRRRERAQRCGATLAVQAGSFIELARALTYTYV